jgi:hypothetical protein
VLVLVPPLLLLLLPPLLVLLLLLWHREVVLPGMSCVSSSLMPGSGRGLLVVVGTRTP